MLKRLLLPALLAAALLGAPQAARAQITLSDQEDSVSASSTTGTCTITAASGGLNVVGASLRNGQTFSGVADDRSQTYTAVTTPVATVGGSARTAIYYFPNALSGSTTITVTAASADIIAIWCASFTGVLTSSPVLEFDTVQTASGTSHPAASPGMDIASGNLVVAMYGQSATITDETPQASYTACENDTGGNLRQYCIYRIAGGALTGETFTVTASDHASAAMVAEFGAASAPSSGLLLRRRRN